MTYTELEEKYYVTLQLASEHERNLTSALVEKNELLKMISELQTKLKKQQQINDDLENVVVEQKASIAKMKTLLNEADKTKDYMRDKFKRMLNSLKEAKGQYSDHSIFVPMKEIAVPPGNNNAVIVENQILDLTEEVGFFKDFDQKMFLPKLHVYAKSGSKVLRYSNEKLYESAFMSSDQQMDAICTMCDNLKTQMYREFSSWKG